MRASRSAYPAGCGGPHPRRTGHELSEQDVLDSPHVFIGSLDRLVEKFLQLREELGVPSFLLGGAGALEPVLERLVGR